MQEENKPKQVTVQAYSFADALTELQSYVKQGYEVDVETNGTYPMLIGSLMIFSVILKEDGVVLKDAETQVVQTPTVDAPEAPPAIDTEGLKETLEDLVEATVEAVEAAQATAKRGRPKASA